MSAQTFVQKILQKHLIRSQAKNPTYSIRSFARRLEISPSALSEILNGKRKISLQMAKRLLLKTSANAKEMEQALRLFKGSSKTEEKETNGFEEISLQQFNIIADWYHFAILSLAETDDFRDEPEWLSLIHI